MKKTIVVLTLLIFFTSCENKKKEFIPVVKLKLNERAITLKEPYIKGKSYLSVYPQIYNITEHRRQNLTATVSIRNTSEKDSLFIKRASYYNTKGDLIRSYIASPIYLQPLETIEIVIDERDKEGGTGANFIFDWAKRKQGTEPIFEAVMISTLGQQGLSFLTQGKRIDKPLE